MGWVCLLWGTNWKLKYFTREICASKVVHWVRRLVWGRLPQRPGFDSRSVHRRFVVNKVALGQVFVGVRLFPSVSIIPTTPHTHILRVRLFPSVSIIPTTPHTNIHLHVCITWRINGQSVAAFRGQCSSGNQGILGRKLLPLFCAPEVYWTSSIAALSTFSGLRLWLTDPVKPRKA